MDYQILIFRWASFQTGGTGAALWPFIDSMNPSADVVALSTVEIDLSSIQVGQRIMVNWRGQPVLAP